MSISIYEGVKCRCLSEISFYFETCGSTNSSISRHIYSNVHCGHSSLSSWRNQFTNYLYNLSAAGWCSHIRGIQAWSYVWVWIWNLLFWAIVLLTYIISPHGEVYLLENCVMLFTQYDALHCFGLSELLLLRRKLRCQLKLLKKSVNI